MIRALGLSKSRRAKRTSRVKGLWGGRVGGATFIALGLLAGTLSGCSSVRNSLGTSNAPCYIALPAASAAIRGHGRLLGVRLEKVDSFPVGSHLREVASKEEPNIQRVCLVAFQGSYNFSDVSKPAGRIVGMVAVVVVGYPDGHLLATLILRRVPLRFGHSRIGPV